jgi:acyl CoA:acetate/3-ketoacid CoA transferase
MSGQGKLVSAREAVECVRPGDTVAVGGIISLCVAETVLHALGNRFRDTGEPGNLTVFCPNRAGWAAEGPRGLEHLAQPGMMRRLITSTFGGRDTPDLVRSALAGEIETYCFPMGLLFRLTRELAARSPGMLTKVGLNTFADPEAATARGMLVSDRIPPQDLVSRVEIGGEPCLIYKTFPVHVAILRGSVADPDGNVSLAGEPVSAAARHLAMAAHNSGGKVIVQVKHMTERGMLHPRMVEIPGVLVDHIVLDPAARQTQIGDDPAWTGEVRTPTPPVEHLPLDHQKIILRRAAAELSRGAVVNLGVGIPTRLPALALEEGFLSNVTFSVEHGALGGIPAAGVPGQIGAFGAHYNPSAIIDSPDVFDFYHGGGLDLSCLGFAQIDAEGSVNVSAFNGSLRGPGGFIDIVHATKTIVFCGTLTAGGLSVEIRSADSGQAPRVRIRTEGRNRKFIPRVEQVNLHGPSAVAKGQRVLIVTERGVFRVVAGGVELVEIAPGMEMDRDIRSAVGFDIRVSPELREMDGALFASRPMGLVLQ